MQVKLRDDILSEGERIVLMIQADSAAHKFVGSFFGQNNLRGEELESQRTISSFVRGIADKEWDISKLTEGERLALGLLLEKAGF